MKLLIMGQVRGHALNILILRFRCIMEIVKGQEFVCPKKTQSKSSVSWKTAEPVRGNETAGEFDKKYDIIEEKV